MSCVETDLHKCAFCPKLKIYFSISSIEAKLLQDQTPNIPQLSLISLFQFPPARAPLRLSPARYSPGSTLKIFTEFSTALLLQAFGTRNIRATSGFASLVHGPL